jgi:hypothetical protein
MLQGTIREKREKFLKKFPEAQPLEPVKDKAK